MSKSKSSWVRHPSAAAGPRARTNHLSSKALFLASLSRPSLASAEATDIVRHERHLKKITTIANCHRSYQRQKRNRQNYLHTSYRATKIYTNLYKLPAEWHATFNLDEPCSAPFDGRSNDRPEPLLWLASRADGNESSRLQATAFCTALLSTRPCGRNDFYDLRFKFKNDGHAIPQNQFYVAPKLLPV